METQYPLRVTKTTAQILGLNNTTLSSLKIAPTKLIKPQETYATTNAFLGTPEPYGRFTPLGLITPAKTKQLAAIGCAPRATHYHKGLVNTMLKAKAGTTYVDIVKVKAYVDKHLSQSIEASDKRNQSLHLLHALASSLQDAINDTSKDFSSRLCIGERNITLAQIGCLFLPITFIGALQSPVAFISDTAPALGGYVLSKL